jgi:hypothetical protein
MYLHVLVHVLTCAGQSLHAPFAIWAQARPCLTHLSPSLCPFAKRSLRCHLPILSLCKSVGDTPTCSTMDPSTEEQLTLTTVPFLCTWACVSDDLLGRISTSLGGPPQHIRQTAFIPYKVWDHTIHNIPGAPPQDPEAPALLGPTSMQGFPYLMHVAGRGRRPRHSGLSRTPTSAVTARTQVNLEAVGAHKSYVGQQSHPTHRCNH